MRSNELATTVVHRARRTAAASTTATIWSGRALWTSGRALGRKTRALPSWSWVALAAVALLPVLWINLTGALAGVLSDGRPVLVGPVAAWQTIASILSDGIGRWAWSDEVQQGLGRWKQVRGSAWIAGLVTVALTGYLWVLSRSMKVERLRTVYRERGARWAIARELKRLEVRGATPGRVILGTRDGKLLASEINASTLIIAPSQAGKTTGLAVPAMVEWAGPCLATSVKGDLLVDTILARRRIGEVKVFDPTGSTSVAGSTWSPVAAATSWSAARRVAASILQIGMRQHGGQDDSFWRQAGAAYLAPLLLAGNYLQVSTAVVLRWATSTEEDAIAEAKTALKALVKSKTLGSGQALHDLEQMWGVDDRYRSSVIGTLSTHLDAWKEPALERATADDGDGITPEWLLDGNNTLFLSAPAAEQRRLRGLFTALVIEVVAAAFARAAKTGRPLDPRLLLMMDEAANIAPLPNIDEIASTGPGQGVLLCTILQNLSQAEETWGKDRADTILANHRARLFGAGIGDASTLEYIGRILGDEVRESTSISKKRFNPIDLGSRNESLEYRSLLGAHEIRQLGEGQVLLIYGQLPPTRLALRPWYKDRKLRQLVEAKGPRLVRAPSMGTATCSDRGPAGPSRRDVAQVAGKPAAAVSSGAEQLTIDDELAPALDTATGPGPMPSTRPPAVVSGGWFETPGDPRARLERALGTDAAQAIADLRLASAIGGIVEGAIVDVLAGDRAASLAYPGHLEVLVNLPSPDHHVEALLQLGAAQDPADGGEREWWTGAGGERLAVRYLDEPVAADEVAVDGVGPVFVVERAASAVAGNPAVVGD